MSVWALLIGLTAMFGVSAVWHYRREHGTQHRAHATGVDAGGADISVIAFDASSHHGSHGFSPNDASHGDHSGGFSGGDDSGGGDGGGGGD